MSGLIIETTGIALAALPYAVSLFEKSGLGVGGRRRDIFEKIQKYLHRIRENGFLTTLLLTVLFPDALSVMDRVEHFVLHTDDRRVVGFLKSYTSSFNMVGVAVRVSLQVKSLLIIIICVGRYHSTGCHFSSLSCKAGRFALDF
jgi:hypothetical protein